MNIHETFFAHRKALEAKAALYDRLCGGEGLKMGGSDSEGEDGEGRYMVDFTRKIAEEVSVCVEREGLRRLVCV